MSIHIFKRTANGPRFLMLRRCPSRGGFWQGVTGAPLPGETHAQAAMREVFEETAFDVAGTLAPLGISYSYALPEVAERREHLHGPGVERITVTTFGAEIPDGDPVLDPREHDAFSWCSHEEADALLDWPIEQDALGARREALHVLNTRLLSEPSA